MDFREFVESNIYSVTEFCYRCKISIPTFYRYKKGHKPSYKIAKRIEKATKNAVTVEELMKQSPYEE